MRSRFPVCAFLGRRLLSTVAALALAANLAAAPAPASRMSVGVNLSAVDYWSTQWTFIDVFKQAAPWVAQRTDGVAWDTREKLSLTPDGWIAKLKPGQAAATLLFRDAGGHYPAGDYVCLYKGHGTIAFGMDARTIEAAPGRIRVRVTPTDLGILLRIVATDAGNPIRDIRLLPPGFESARRGDLFPPIFLERLHGFRVLRFMDFAKTNGQKVSRWEDRPTPAQAMQTSDRGVALEYMIALCNRLGADAWFCMPHRADDDYVRRFAQTVHKKLRPDLRVYVEYSNEVWNDRFPQARYAREQGLNLQLDADPKKAQHRFYARRAVEIFGIWENVFGSHDRLVRVLAAQADWPAVGEDIVSFQDAYRHADALAVGAYFFAGVPPEKLVSLSRDEILDSSQAAMENHAALQKNLETARRHGLTLIAYEGGQHLVAQGVAVDDAALTEKLIACNRSPRMADLYTKSLEDWQGLVGTLYMHYAFVARPTKWGSWGLLEWQDQNPSDAPKYRALKSFMDRR